MRRRSALHLLHSGKHILGRLYGIILSANEVWLMSHEITPDEDNVALDIGRAVHEIFYNKTLKEFSMEG